MLLYKKYQKGAIFPMSKRKIDKTLENYKHLDWVQRLYEKDTPSIILEGETQPSTHYMESADNRVYPTIVREEGDLKYLGDKAYDYADSTNTYIPFKNERQAERFAKGYKKGTGILINY